MKTLYKSIFIVMMSLLVMKGLQAQPVFVKDISSECKNFFSAGGYLYFTVHDTLWKSNGLAGTTKPLIKIGEQFTSQFVVNGTHFYFTTIESSGKTAL